VEEQEMILIWVYVCNWLSQRANSIIFHLSMQVRILTKLLSSKKSRWTWCQKVASHQVSSTSFLILFHQQEIKENKIMCGWNSMEMEWVMKFIESS
jgi:hypothetical protein